MTASPSLLRFDLGVRRGDVQPASGQDAEAQIERPAGAHSLAALADALSAELEPLLTREPPIPEYKAKLTRSGGRCPVHGTLLAFDPWLPQEHRCERCGVAYRGRSHDEWWAMGAQLWTVERAVHGAALYAVRGRSEHAALAARILRGLAQRYTSWPNQDNVLGPSRPFFSTYLESIWLLNVCHALSLLERAGAPGVDALGTMLRETLIAPSAKLIEGFPEGLSNRQVWNEVALLSAHHLLDDARLVRRRLAMHGGLPWIMAHGLLSDGTWYEGENYHLFAHRGLWYGMQLMKSLQHPVAAQTVAKYREGFVTPFAGLLPDDTLPSRRDSQYATSVRQWRIAEWLELGFAESSDVRIAGMLTRLYDGHAKRRDTGRRCSTADAERNGPGTSLTRADLSWRALLLANADAPPTSPWLETSNILPTQGLSVLRRDSGRTYIALEGGHRGGGHGHPDALALTLQSGDARWLDDPGTGSYTERALHWYRSTLAHAAPLIDRASFRPESIELIAFDDQPEVGWICKRAYDVATGVTIERTVVVSDQYLVDVVEWQGGVERELTLPLAGAARVHGGAEWVPTEQRGAGGLEDGFDFALECETIPFPALLQFDALARRADAADDATLPIARAWYASTGDGHLVRATVPGAPGQPAVKRHWLQVRGVVGRVIGVWNWPSASGRVQSVRLNTNDMPCATIVDSHGTTTTHRRVGDGWHVDLRSDSASRGIRLASIAPTAAAPTAMAPMVDQSARISAATRARDAVRTMRIPNVRIDDLAVLVGTPIPGALRVALGESHYVATEATWANAGAPRALAQLGATPDDFIVDVDVWTGPIVTSPPDFENPLDNERADVNSDGLQWYIGHIDQHAWSDGGLIVPAPAEARATALFASSVCVPMVSWRLTTAGWAMRLRWPRTQLPLDDGGAFLFDLVVNERPPERERRRGQLVLSGGGGFGYLRGDRHGVDRALKLSLL